MIKEFEYFLACKVLTIKIKCIPLQALMCICICEHDVECIMMQVIMMLVCCDAALTMEPIMLHLNISSSAGEVEMIIT